MIYFFFQAEDGIRDLTVTGVQTCALPISRACALPGRKCARSSATSSSAFSPRKRASSGGSIFWRRARSEERRVGKECRSRCSPYHYKNKQLDRISRRGV